MNLKSTCREMNILSMAKQKLMTPPKFMCDNINYYVNVRGTITWGWIRNRHILYNINTVVFTERGKKCNNAHF